MFNFIRFYLDVIHQKPHKTADAAMEWLQEKKGEERHIFVIDAFMQIGLPYSDAEVISIFNACFLQHKVYRNFKFIAAKIIFWPLFILIQSIIKYPSGFFFIVLYYFLIFSYFEINATNFLVYTYLKLKKKEYRSNSAIWGILKGVIGARGWCMVGPMGLLVLWQWDLWLNLMPGSFSIVNMIIISLLVIIITSIFSSFVNMVMVNLVRGKLRGG